MSRSRVVGLLSLLIVVGLAGGRSASGVDPSPVGRVPDSAFRPVSTPRSAADTRPFERVDVSALPGEGTSPPPTPAPKPRVGAGVAASPRGPEARGKDLPTRPTPAAPQRAGVASWYDDGPGLYAAIGTWQWGDRPYALLVCAGDRCVRVTVRDHCHGCMDGRPLLDLSPQAFARLAPLSRGIIPVHVSVATP